MSVLFSKTEVSLSIREMGKSRGGLMANAKLSCRLNEAVS